MFLNGRSKWKSGNNFIFHVKINHLIQDRKRLVNPTLFLQTLAEDGWQIIYLRRKNKVKHALSGLVAKNRRLHQPDIWHKYDDNREELNIFVDCEQFTKRVEKRINLDACEREVLADLEYHEVVYEDDLEQPESHQKTVNRILNYLSLEPRLASTNLRKVNSHSLKELIFNYEEFVGCLSRSGWKKFLE